MRARIASGSGSPWVVCVLVACAGIALAQRGVRAPAAPVQRDEACTRVVLEGFVVEHDGTPAVNAVVASSAGGKAVTGLAGDYALEVEPPLEATSLQLTAYGAGGIASTSVTLGAVAPSIPVTTLQLARLDACPPRWLSRFGARPGVDEYGAYSFAVFDDGNGPALYVGGRFTVAGGVSANRIVKWDGSSWSPLGIGLDDSQPANGNSGTFSLAVHDDGSGPALYVGGYFTTAGGLPANSVARWDGANWSAVGSGRIWVEALAVFDDGSGPALYASSGTGIWKWDGVSWSVIGSVNPNTQILTEVLALAVHDDGSGPALYAGGWFSSVSGVSANAIAKWDGDSWSALGSGIQGGVAAMAVFDDGGGPALYAGGNFWTAGGAPASDIAKWDGSSWSEPGGGITTAVDRLVSSLVVHDDGNGPALYAAGNFYSADGAPSNCIAKWDGGNWSALGDGLGGTTYDLIVFDDGGGPALFAGGTFATASGASAGGFAKWSGSSWTTYGSGINGRVKALATFDDGSGPALYVGGSFPTVGGVTANFIAKRDGASWSALGSGVDWGVVQALAAFDDGSGPALYAGGTFEFAGGLPAKGIAKWDGTSWSALGSGVDREDVRALAVFDDGGGPDLYVGGGFSWAGGIQASRIARWNGSSWSTLGSGLAGDVNALVVHDDGSGPALYAGGWFRSAGGVSAHRVAKWNGSSWSGVGGGIGPPVATADFVSALAVYDDGSGPALYAGGSFSQAGGVTAHHIAKWDGSSWSALGSEIDAAAIALAVHDDGSGPALYAGGHFLSAGGLAVRHIARWNGSSWSALGGGLNNQVNTNALFVHDDGSGPALFAGGDFSLCFDSGDSYLAKWGCGFQRFVRAGLR